jgi:DNA-binding MarR family transcriptional regulator
MSKSVKRADGVATAEVGARGFASRDAHVDYLLEQSLAYQLRVTHKYFNDSLQPLLALHEIPVGMWSFLRVLWEEDGLTQREISARVGLVAPTTVEQLRNMEKRGLIERRRSAEDRRKIHVHLTPAGKSLKAELLPLALHVSKLAVVGLSAGEVGFLRLVLARIQANLAGAMQAAPRETASQPY